MIKLRPASERGIAHHGWLTARHTFSFAGYQDPQHVHFRKLRVINEDTIEAGQGFGTHPHEDMEILTYVLSGELEHRDSMGMHGVLRPGDVQVMSAGTGITHSEFNHSKTEPLHLMQIWIFPNRRGHEPRYEDRNYPADARRDQLCPIANPSGTDGALPMHQDASVFASLLSSGRSVSHTLGAGRGAWIQIARGAVEVLGEKLTAGDGASIEGETAIVISATEDAEFLLFDLD
jgi:redox-sensitive bicupin YhaK (pirin superfamily)